MEGAKGKGRTISIFDSRVRFLNRVETLGKVPGVKGCFVVVFHRAMGGR